MSSLGLPEPFMEHPGDPPVPWIQWRFGWENYVELRRIHVKRLNFRCEIPKTGEASSAQQALEYSKKEENLEFVQSLGTEGRRLFTGTENYKDLDREPAAILKDCDELFRSENNPLVGLHRFRKRNQQKDETAKEFAAELRLLSIDCEFGATEIQNKEIATQLCLKCHSEKLQQKLFAEYKKHKCKLSDVLEIMTADENARKDVQALKPGASGSSMGPIQKRQSHRYQKNKSPFQPKNPTDSPAPTAPGQRYCHGCGQKGHKHGEKQCPAFGKKCPHCGNHNHFEKVCHKKKQGFPKQGTVVVGSSQKSDSQIHCKLALSPINGRSHKPKKFEFLVDSGAQASSLHRSEYENNLSHIPLQPTDVVLTNWDGTPGKTKPLGTIYIRASFRSRSAEIKLYIVEDSCLQVIGLKEMSSLSMQIDTTSKSVSVVKPSFQVPPSADKPSSKVTFCS